MSKSSSRPASLYEGASENDPLLRATTIKYEHRYAHLKLVLRRSIIILMVALGLIFVFDVARLILRRDTYDPGNGNMIPQAIMVILLGGFVFVFKNREKTTVMIVVYITVLVLFFFFSLAILPSFIKEIIIDFDVLCPALIALTGITALIVIYLISVAYRFLKFHRKYTKRKATLPVVLQSSPQWQRKLQPQDEDDFVSVLFPTQEVDPKVIQEQWEKFQQSRLYLPENSPRPPPRRTIPPPSSSASQPTPTPGQITQEERWERFHRSPIFSVNNKSDNAQQPQIGRARRNTTKEPLQHNPALRRSTPSLPFAPPSPSPPADISAHPPEPTQDSPQPASVTQDTQPRSRRVQHLDRNPSFRYGAYVHEPTQFRAHPDDTPEEYTRLASGNRSGSLPNMSDTAPTLAPRPEAPHAAHASPVELESFGANSDDDEPSSTHAIGDAMRKDHRKSFPARAAGTDHTHNDTESLRSEPVRLESFASHFKIDNDHVDSPRPSDAALPHMPKLDKFPE